MAQDFDTLLAQMAASSTPAGPFMPGAGMMPEIPQAPQAPQPQAAPFDVANTGNALADINPALLGVNPGPPQLPPGAMTPEQAQGVIASPPKPGEALTGPQTAGLAMLAGQLPHLGGQIGRMFDGTSDERAKTDVSDDSSDIGALLRALGG